jgi:hypothetical protein
MSNPRAQKRQLEMARLERAAAKRERRQTRGAPGEAPPASDASGGLSQEDLLARLADLHRRYADHELSLEEFEATRDELVQHLRVD